MAEAGKGREPETLSVASGERGASAANGASWADRYSRQIRFAPIGRSGQERLAAARVLIVGCGALGASLAQHMVRAGIGTVRIADRDIVEPSNLQRQMLFDESDALNSLPKAIAAANRLRRINGEVAVEPHVMDVTSTSAALLADDADLVLDGTDNAATRLALSDVCFRLGIPFLYGGVTGSRGMSAMLVPGETACLRCLIGDDGAGTDAETCDTTGVIAPIVEAVTALQAVEALKWLSGGRDALRRTWLSIDLWPYAAAESRMPGPTGSCSVCGHAKLTERSVIEAEPEGQGGLPMAGRIHPAPEGIADLPVAVKDRQMSRAVSSRSMELQSPAVALCGRNTVQVTLGFPLDLQRARGNAAARGWAAAVSNPYLVRADLPDGIRLALFPDGRVLVQGTKDTKAALELCSRYIPQLIDGNERSVES